MAMCLPSYKGFKERFPVMFEFYENWRKLHNGDVKELTDHWQRAAVVWKDGYKEVPIPTYAAVYALSQCNGDLSKAKRVCMSLNHTSGKGCLQSLRKATPGCGLIHKCLCCGKSEHGMHHVRPNGSYVCPKYKRYLKETRAYVEEYGNPDDHEQELLELVTKPLPAGQRASAQARPRHGFTALLSDSDDEESGDDVSEAEERGQAVEDLEEAADTGANQAETVTVAESGSTGGPGVPPVLERADSTGMAPSPAPAPVLELPEGWAAAQDEEGNTYYYHKGTREARWEPPPSTEVATGTRAGEAGLAVKGTAEPTERTNEDMKDRGQGREDDGEDEGVRRAGSTVAPQEIHTDLQAGERHDLRTMLPYDAAEVLEQEGVYTLSELADLEKEDLTPAFARHGLRLGSIRVVRVVWKTLQPRAS